MSNFLNPNLTGINAFIGLSSRSRATADTLTRLASGKRIGKAADDPASLAVATNLGTRADALSQSMRNVNQGIGLVHTAGGAAGEVNTILSRMRHLAVQSSNGTLNNTQRGAIQTEYSELASELDRVAQGSTFNGIGIADGSVPLVSVQAGEDGTASSQLEVRLHDMQAATLGVAGSAVDSQAGAQQAIDQIDGAISRVNRIQADYGSSVQRLESAFRTAESRSGALAAAESQILDADVAVEASELASQQLLDRAQIAVQAQANKLRLAAASLI